MARYKRIPETNFAFKGNVAATFLKGVAVGLAAALILASMPPAHAQEFRSFESSNFHGRYIRHRNFFGYIDPITQNDRLGRKDATFRLVPGLAGKCRSFESANFPNHFLRHQNFRVQLAPRSDDELFKQDATFCVRPGLANSDASSFESINFPGFYIRHSNFELWLNKFDGTRLFRKDATFFIVPNLVEHFPQIIDEGTNLNPVDE